MQVLFQLQKGFGGFSYSGSQRDGVIQYIMNQENIMSKNRLGKNIWYYRKSSRSIL